LAVHAHEDFVYAHPFLQRYLAVSSFEGADEVVGDLLRDDDRAIGFYVGYDLSLGNEKCLS